MCLIIQRDANVELPFEKFKTAVENNPDGYGLAVPDGEGRLLTIRDHNKPNVDDLYKLVNEEFKQEKLLLHLRYTTVGETILRNAHPFPILEYEQDGIDLRMAHNGTLSAYKGNTNESDTRRFVRQFVRPLFKRLAKGCDVQELLKDDWVQWLIDNELTTSSVVSFIDGFGNALNVNALGNGGKQEEGVYYSNTYSFDPKHRVPYSNYYSNAYFNNNKPKTKGTSVVVGQSTVFAKDTETKKFSDLYQLPMFSDVVEFSDELIENIVKHDQPAAVALIKELINEYKFQSNRSDN